PHFGAHVFCLVQRRGACINLAHWSPSHNTFLSLVFSLSKRDGFHQSSGPARRVRGRGCRQERESAAREEIGCPIGLRLRRARPCYTRTAT
ncbi:unnamed protein product, partial [Mycena citricolor]